MEQTPHMVECGYHIQMPAFPDLLSLAYPQDPKFPRPSQYFQNPETRDSKHESFSAILDSKHNRPSKGKCFLTIFRKRFTLNLSWNCLRDPGYWLENYLLWSYGYLRPPKGTPETRTSTFSYWSAIKGKVRIILFDIFPLQITGMDPLLQSSWLQKNK